MGVARRRHVEHAGLHVGAQGHEGGAEDPALADARVGRVRGADQAALAVRGLEQIVVGEGLPHEGRHQHGVHHALAEQIGEGRGGVQIHRHPRGHVEIIPGEPQPVGADEDGPHLVSELILTRVVGVVADVVLGQGQEAVAEGDHGHRARGGVADRVGDHDHELRRAGALGDGQPRLVQLHPAVGVEVPGELHQAVDPAPVLIPEGVAVVLGVDPLAALGGHQGVLIGDAAQGRVHLGVIGHAAEDLVLKAQALGVRGCGGGLHHGRERPLGLSLRQDRGLPRQDDLLAAHPGLPGDAEDLLGVGAAELDGEIVAGLAAPEGREGRRRGRGGAVLELQAVGDDHRGSVAVRQGLQGADDQGALIVRLAPELYLDPDGHPLAGVDVEDLNRRGRIHAHGGIVGGGQVGGIHPAALDDGDEGGDVGEAVVLEEVQQGLGIAADVGRQDLSGVARAPARRGVRVGLGVEQGGEGVGADAADEGITVALGPLAGAAAAALAAHAAELAARAARAAHRPAGPPARALVAVIVTAHHGEPQGRQHDRALHRTPHPRPVGAVACVKGAAAYAIHMRRCRRKCAPLSDMAPVSASRGHDLAGGV